MNTNFEWSGGPSPTSIDSYHVRSFLELRSLNSLPYFSCYSSSLMRRRQIGIVSSELLLTDMELHSASKVWKLCNPVPFSVLDRIGVKYEICLNCPYLGSAQTTHSREAAQPTHLAIFSLSHIQDGSNTWLPPSTVPHEHVPS